MRSEIRARAEVFEGGGGEAPRRPAPPIRPDVDRRARLRQFGVFAPRPPRAGFLKTPQALTEANSGVLGHRRPCADHHPYPDLRWLKTVGASDGSLRPVGGSRRQEPTGRKKSLRDGRLAMSRSAIVVEENLLRVLRSGLPVALGDELLRSLDSLPKRDGGNPRPTVLRRVSGYGRIGGSAGKVAGVETLPPRPWQPEA